eukprot:1163325-Prymnesium_polylepis.1
MPRSSARSSPRNTFDELLRVPFLFVSVGGQQAGTRQPLRGLPPHRTRRPTLLRKILCCQRARKEDWYEHTDQAEDEQNWEEDSAELRADFLVGGDSVNNQTRDSLVSGKENATQRHTRSAHAPRP